MSPPDETPPDQGPAVESIGVLGSGRRQTRAARRRRPRRRGRVFLVLVLLALPFVAGLGWFWYQVDPPGAPGAAVRVTVPKGAGIAQIARRLEARGVVGSAFAFRVYAQLSGTPAIQAGDYRLRRDLGARAAVAALERGPDRRYTKLVLPPGITFEEIATKVGQLPGRSADRFRAIAVSGTVRSKFQPATVTSLEGLTWPDTYLVASTDTEQSILRTLVDAFDRNADAAGLAASADPYRTIIVASLIEREAGVDEDRPLIAAVVANRIRDQMPLQIDATVLYARGGGSSSLTDADFARDSPYNTYRVPGLPPTPISTVTDSSLRAAIAPADVPFKYYVLTETNGKHAFSVTFAEHERNIADARRRGVLP